MFSDWRGDLKYLTDSFVDLNTLDQAKANDKITYSVKYS